MLSTVPEILDFVKREYRINGTADDTYLVQLISKNYWQRATKTPFKETITQAATFTTSTSTQYYSTSSDFGRLVPNSIRYGVTATSAGSFIPEVPFEQYEYYRNSTTGSDPAFATIVGSGSATPGKRIMLFPPFTNSASVVSYDYYAKPTSLSSTATLPVSDLAEVVAYDTLSDWARHVNDNEGQKDYKIMARDCWTSAFQNVLPNT